MPGVVPADELQESLMKLPPLVAGSVLVLMISSAFAQTTPSTMMPAGGGTTMPNANPTPEAPANGTMPNANGTSTAPNTTSTMTPVPPANPTNPTCTPGSQATATCTPPINPACTPGQTPAAGCPPTTP
jgi:hypothetical protein